MNQALDDVAVEEPVRSALRALFTTASAYVVNAGPEPAVTSGEPQACADAIHKEMAMRWGTQLALDQAVAAIHRGAGDCAIALAEAPTLSALRA